MNYESTFKKLGFDEFKSIKTDDIIFSHDVFNQCARNTCGNFGKNHACPPKSGTEVDGKNRVLNFDNAYLLNKIVPITTGEEMLASLETVSELNNNLREAFNSENVMVMGAGPCTVCKTCSALDGHPCNFPDKTQYSMEGSGIDVVSMSIKQGMTYNAGAGKVGYFTLFLY